MNALTQLNNLPERKEQIKTFAAAGINEILNGNYSALEFKARAEFIRKALDAIESHAAVKDLILYEAKKYNDQDFAGAKIQVQKRKSFNFSVCDDPVWNDLNKQVNDLKERQKQRELFLKCLKEQIALPDSGEVINPPMVNETKYVIFK